MQHPVGCNNMPESVITFEGDYYGCKLSNDFIVRPGRDATMPKGLRSDIPKPNT